MATKRITMQDIADACGLSRNTVSKIFNDRGSVPEATRQMVLAKAQELGYYTYPVAVQQTVVAATVPKNIAVLSSSNPLNHHFGAYFIKAFTDTVCRDGYTVQMYELSPEEVQRHQLPTNITASSLVGVLCIELFDENYIRWLCEQGLPVVLADAFCGANRDIFSGDVVSMENIASSMVVTRHMIRNGAQSLGFVGDIQHCNSFHERWEGFREAVQEAGLTLDPAQSILAPDGLQYGDPDWTVAQLKKMPVIPRAFYCANDYHAINIIMALRRMGIAVPQDVMVAGFGDGPECAIVDPALTSSNIPNSELGELAAETLLARCANPKRPYCFTYVQTKPVFRSSTAGNAD